MDYKERVEEKRKQLVDTLIWTIVKEIDRKKRRQWTRNLSNLCEVWGIKSGKRNCFQIGQGLKDRVRNEDAGNCNSRQCIEKRKEINR